MRNAKCISSIIMQLPTMSCIRPDNLEVLRQWIQRLRLAHNTIRTHNARRRAQDDLQINRILAAVDRIVLARDNEHRASILRLQAANHGRRRLAECDCSSGVEIDGLQRLRVLTWIVEQELGICLVVELHVAERQVCITRVQLRRQYPGFREDAGELRWEEVRIACEEGGVCIRGIVGVEVVCDHRAKTVAYDDDLVEAGVWNGERECTGSGHGDDFVELFGLVGKLDGGDGVCAS